MTDPEPGTDLSFPTETPCLICGVMVPNESVDMHNEWHGRQMLAPSVGWGVASSANMLNVYSGMPMDQVINQLADAIRNIQMTVGTEGNYRFLRDYAKP